MPSKLLLLAVTLPLFSQAPAGQTLPIPNPSTALAELSNSIEDLATAASPAVVRISVHVRAPLDKDSSDRTGFVANQESNT